MKCNVLTLLAKKRDIKITYLFFVCNISHQMDELKQSYFFGLFIFFTINKQVETLTKYYLKLQTERLLS